jgi:hypothetical protein
MNSIINEVFPLFELYQSLRNQLMDTLEDGDLFFQLPGDNPTLGELCLEIGEVERSYIDSFKTFKQDFSYRNREPGLSTSVNRLVAWYEDLDRELKATIESLSEDDIQNRLIDRGDNFTVSPRIQLEIYKEALIIFYGKCSVYLKALGKPRSEQWQHWIA